MFNELGPVVLVIVFVVVALTIAGAFKLRQIRKSGRRNVSGGGGGTSGSGDVKV